jgi:hypothetical protein
MASSEVVSVSMEFNPAASMRASHCSKVGPSWIVT